MMKTKKKKKMKGSKPPSSPFSFWSLPYDIALNCLARIPRIYHPKLSLVSKEFRSILASSELDATRSNIGKTEDCLYVYIDKSNNKQNPPRWFTFGPNPRKKLIPIPPCPYSYPESSTVLSVGSKIYIIGGLFKGKRTNSVFLLDCISHQWHRLPKMRVDRKSPAADVIDGKIYVIGGTNSTRTEDWGESYDLKTRTWKPITTLDLSMQKSVVPGRLVMGGNVYAKMNDGSNRYVKKIQTCMVEIEEHVMCQVCVSNGVLCWRVAKEDLKWSRVEGHEELFSIKPCPYFSSVIRSGGGRRVMVWWKSVHGDQTKIWCAELSFERYCFRGLHASVEWFENVFTTFSRSLCAYSSTFNFLLHSAIVTMT